MPLANLFNEEHATKLDPEELQVTLKRNLKDLEVGLECESSSFVSDRCSGVPCKNLITRFVPKIFCPGRDP